MNIFRLFGVVLMLASCTADRQSPTVPDSSQTVAPPSTAQPSPDASADQPTDADQSPAGEPLPETEPVKQGSPQNQGTKVPVEALAASPDGQIIAVGSGDQTILIKSGDGRDGREIRRFTDLPGRNHPQFLPDGRLVLMSWNDNRSVLWAVDGKAPQQSRLGRFYCADFYDSAWACTTHDTGYKIFEHHGLSDRLLIFERWTNGSAQEIARVANKNLGSPVVLTVSVDGSFVAGGKNPYSSTETQSLPVHRDSPDGGPRAYFFEDVPRIIQGGFVRQWNRTGILRCEWTRVGEMVISVGVGRDGTVIAGNEDGSVHLLSTSGCTSRQLAAVHEAPVKAALLLPRSDVAVTGDQSGRLVWWDTSDGTRIR